MKTIKFGNKWGTLIKKDDFIQNIHNKIKPLYDINTRSYSFLNKSNINNLNNNNKYYVTISTFGKKFLLFLTKINNINYCFFINKKKLNDIIIVNFNFDDELYTNTLIDGEFIKKNNNEWLFLISDIILHNGVLISKHPLNNKLQILENIFKNKFKINESDVCLILIKKYFDYKYLTSICETHINKLPYKCSGIVFKKNHGKSCDLLFIFPENRTKNNNENLNNIFLKVNKTFLPDVYELYANSKSCNEEKLGIAAIPTIECSLKLYNDFSHTNTNIYKCIFNNKFKKWVPVNISNENKITNIELLNKLDK